MLRLLLAPFLRWASTLKYPALFKLVAGLFVVTLFVPDPIPLLDEVLLGLLAMMLAKWKSPEAKAEQREQAQSNARKDLREASRQRAPIEGRAQRV